MKFLRQKDFTVIFDFLENSEVTAFNSFMETNAWGEVEGDPHWSMNISSAEIGLIAQKIQLRLKLAIQNIYSCSLSDETLGTFVKYRLGYGLPLHYDAAKVDDITGEKTINKTFSGCTTTDMTSILYLKNDSIGGLISFPNLDITYYPLKGSVIIFPASKEYEHEVSPVISGDRIITTTFWHVFDDTKNKI
jgi:hypothetical protein